MTKTLLITGAAGGVGGHLRRELAGRYRLRLSDLRPVGKLAPAETFMKGDIAKLADALRITKGVDAVIHLGGYSVEGPWDDILSANIVGCYNVFEAARRNRVARVLFATSNHAVGFYPRDRKINHLVPTRPDGRYGVSKVFGEALGSLYADKYGLRVFCMRLGNVNDVPVDKRRLSIWQSPRDLAQLVTIGLEHPDVRFEIVYGVSANSRAWYDNANAARLGYRPQDDSEPFAAEVLAREPAVDPAAERWQGGIFAVAEALPNPAAPAGDEARPSSEDGQDGARDDGIEGPREEAMTNAAPNLAAPSGACDTHIHFYDAAVPAAPGTPMPGTFTVADYAAVQKRLGLERVIVVQPNAYVADNTVTLNAMAALGAGARGIAVVKANVSEAELDRLTKAGMRGVRFMTLYGGTLGFEVMDRIAARVRPFGWHSDIQLDGRELPERVDQIAKLPGPLVIDHIGKFLEPVPPEHEAFKALLKLIDTGRCWVKLSGPYETSKTGAPRYDDVGLLARALVAHAPERMLWASNWPHPTARRNPPDEAGLLDLLLDWAPDEATRRKILVDNPAELYGFA